MKRLVFLAVVMSMACGADARSVRVKPYFKKDGTFVQGHMRTSPNRTQYDNWSTRGNFNPYTGQEGRKDPYPLPVFTPAPVYRQSAPNYTYTPPPSSRSVAIPSRSPTDEEAFANLYRTWLEREQSKTQDPTQFGYVYQEGEIPHDEEY
ncbi:hypothetical protein M2345_002716 [Sphingobium sp. B8D3D]|nr:hypothetical protein [Sphingobium sp. B8D3D]MCW2414745.1 hypothetical protein [Sphingobium sp. B8D3A]